jgi:hypothetical protein
LAGLVRVPLPLPVLIAVTCPVSERMRVRQIANDGGRRLLRIVHRGMTGRPPHDQDDGKRANIEQTSAGAPRLKIA